MTTVVKLVKKSWEYGSGRTALAAVCAHSVSISIGMCQGYSAILIPQLMADEDFNIDSSQGSWLASLGVITNPVGSVLSGVLAEYLGRKKAIQVSSIPFLVGFLCIATSDSIWGLYAGRLVTGIAGGMSSACYTYVSEISSPQRRGIFQALGPVSASTGILTTYVLGYFMCWWKVAYCSVIFSVFSFTSMHFMPESPAYLAKNGKKQESLASLMWFRRSNAVAQSEFENYRASNEQFILEDASFREKYLSMSTIHPFLILIGLFFLQEMSGIYTILFYAVNFFQDANLGFNESLASITIGVMRLGMSIIGALLINKFPRKKLCMTSSIGMALSMLVVGVYSRYYEIFSEETRVFPLLPLVCILFNVFFSMIGMVPVPWIMAGELFPLQVRSIMSGVVICMAQIFIFTSVKIYPDLKESLGFGGTVFVFFTTSVIAVFYSRFILPETRNKSLTEIEDFFKSKKSKDLCGVDNKAFVIKPEGLDAANEEKGKGLYTIDITTSEREQQ